MHRGYIKLWRKIVDWTWYKDANTLATFIHLLIKSNHQDTTYMGQPVPRGSCVCGRYALSEDTGISPQSIRTSLEHLKSTNDITIKSTNKFSIISIVNYQEYQDKSTYKSTSKSTFNQPATNQQLTTSKECKNDKNEKKIEREATPQSLDQVKTFFQELGFASYAEEFFDFYASKGWVVGRSPMKCWKSAARRWSRNQKNYQTKEQKNESARDRIRRIAEEGRRQAISSNSEGTVTVG